jgi:hypothetical protein
MNILEQMEAMGLWKPPSREDEPRTKLFQWQVYEVKNPKGTGWDVHFSGNIDGCGGEGRVCSAIQKFDNKTMCGVSQSGRIYELIGDPGYSSNGSYVWSRWLAAYSNIEHRNITYKYKRLV